MLIACASVQRSSCDWYPATAYYSDTKDSQKAGIGYRLERLYDLVPPLASYSNAYDLPFSTASSSTSMDGSGSTWDFSSFQASLPLTGDTEDPIQPNPSRRGHTQSAHKSTRAVGPLLCLQPGCLYQTKRQYDLDRHQKTHFPSNPGEKFDCTGRGCGRTGEYGFDRKDHLREHLRKVHGNDIPKKTRRSN